MNNLSVVLIFLAMVCLGTAMNGMEEKRDRSMDEGGVFLEAKFESGEMRIGRNSDPSKDNNGVKIVLDSISEVDSDGIQVSENHTVSFINYEFESPDPDNMTTDDGLMMKRQNLSLDLNEINIEMKIFMAEEGGDADLGGDKISINIGDVVFDMEIGSWEWCNVEDDEDDDDTTIVCNGTGAYLDLKIGVVGKDKASMDDTHEGNTTSKYDLGGGSNIYLTNAYTADGEDKIMPDGYPKHENDDTTDYYTLRIEKFDDSAYYDPVVTTADSAFKHTGISLLMMVVVLAVLSQQF